jgi:ankyrin repeat protein
MSSLAFAIGRVHTEAVAASLESVTSGSPPSENFAGMMRAALIGHTSAIRKFLDLGAEINAVDNTGRTTLIEAVFGGHLDTVQELLNQGADVNAQDLDGWTALMEAASKGRVDVVRTLLAHGADARMKNKNGWTVLRTTAKWNTELIRILRDAGAS